MRSRKYIHRIDVCRNTYVDDGFGGKKLGMPEMITKSWCNVKTLRADSISNLGLSENNVVIEIDLRYRNDIEYNTRDMFFKYRGLDFNPIRIEPIDINQYEIKITAVTTGESVQIAPLGGFPYTFPITLI